MKKLIFLEPEKGFEKPVLERNGKRDELKRAKCYVGLVFQCLLFIVLPVACFSCWRARSSDLEHLPRRDAYRQRDTIRLMQCNFQKTNLR